MNLALKMSEWMKIVILTIHEYSSTNQDIKIVFLNVTDIKIINQEITL